MLEPNEITALADELELVIKGEGERDAKGLLDERGDDLVAALRARAEEAAAWPSYFPFRKPCDMLGKTYEGLELREPNADEFVRFGFFDNDLTAEKMQGLIAATSGLTPPAIKRMPGFEFNKLCRQIVRFFGSATA